MAIRRVWRAPVTVIAVAGALSSVPSHAAAQNRAALEMIAARGDAAWTARRLDESEAAYDSVVRADSNASSRAVYRLGTLLSWKNRLRDAVALHRLYVRLEPLDLEGHVGLGRTYAYASRFPESVAQYDSVLAKEADYRDAALGKAQTLAWWGKLDESVAAYRAWVSTHPADAESELGLARALSWAGRLDEALEIYAKVAARDGAGREAEKGIARVTGWKGELGVSEEQWRALTVKYPSDPEVWVGLGQILRWQGRTFAAREALQRALAVRPDYDDARSQLRWVNAEIEPGASLTIVRSSDSEHNDGTTLVLGADAAIGDEARWLARVTARYNTATIGSGVSLAARAGVLWQPADGKLSVRVEAGTVRLNASPNPGLSVAWESPPSQFVGGVRLRGQLSSRLVVSAGAARDAFDDVVSTMHEGLSLDTYDTDATLTLPARVAAGAFASSSRAAGTFIESNSRTTAGAWVRWTVKRGLSVGATARTAAWDHPAYGAYFAPQRFTVTELNGHWERPVDLGFLIAADAGFGQQSVRFEQDAATTRATPRGSLMVGWRAAPGREITLTALLANVAAAASVRDAEYRYSAITLAGRFTR